MKEKNSKGHFGGLSADRYGRRKNLSGCIYPQNHYGGRKRIKIGKLGKDGLLQELEFLFQNTEQQKPAPIS